MANINRIYIHENTLSSLLSFLQKGLEQKMKFFVYDPQDLIKDRIWTSIQTSFIPNVRAGDQIILKHTVPIIISINIEDKNPDGYVPIFYETTHCTKENFVAFVKTQDEAKKLCKKKDEMQIFQKNDTKWQDITTSLLP